MDATATPTPLPLTRDQIEMIQRAVAEVATGVGFGVVSIIVEKGEPRRIQRTVDILLRNRAEHAPPLICSAG